MGETRAVEMPKCEMDCWCRRNSARWCPIPRALCDGACLELVEGMGILTEVDDSSGCRKPQKQGWSRPSRPASTVTSKARASAPEVRSDPWPHPSEDFGS